MAQSPKQTTPTWGALLDPDAATYKRLRAAGRGATQLVQCGGGRDAVVIAPLQRGLAALDAMDLPVTDGYAVLADHIRQELIVLVEGGRAAAWKGVAGVRVLSRGSWLLAPARGRDGALASAWLSQPAGPSPAWGDTGSGPCLSGVRVAVDVRALCDALATIDRPAVSSGATT
ncbi:hypothetical protein [Streptomyces monomycini]|uniref:hypothetical protein n=1 Tax=Streptomyces monomycini TaxID=371720 RepID=UPI00067CF698|nr:hypothetical protein [Streptomyces monomycini]